MSSLQGASPLRARLADWVQRFSRARILCLGDVMIDRFVEGAVTRISPESPVPVFNWSGETLLPGGAANVARNVSALGARCTLIGIVGDDVGADRLRRSVEADGGIRTALVVSSDRPTTEKTRFVTQGHHMLRVDVEVARPVDADGETALVAEVRRLIGEHDVLVLSDYAKGALTDAVVRETIALARQAGRRIVVDPKSKSFARYGGATVITPNARETLAASGIDPVSDAAAVAAGRAVLGTVDAEAILITRGEKGMMLVPREGEASSIANGRREVFDVVGAGDTVVASLAVALAVGVELETAARIANAAAGIVVGKRGTATASPDELAQELASQERGPLRRGAPIMLTPVEAVRYAEARRREGRKVGFTNGVFDIVHPGHISILHVSRDACDCLIVGLNSDASVRRLKGPGRPINPERDRAVVVGALGAVDAVVIFDADTPLELIRAIRPDVLVKGADYSLATVVGAEDVMASGGEVLLAPLVPGVSSTRTIEKARRETSR